MGANRQHWPTDAVEKVENLEQIYDSFVKQDTVMIGITSLPPKFSKVHREALYSLPKWRAVMFARIVHKVVPDKFTRAELDKLVWSARNTEERTIKMPKEFQ